LKLVATTTAVGIGLLGVGGLAVALPTSNGDPTHAFTKRDQQWAKKIVLRKADLPTGVKWNAYSTGGAGGSGGGGVACPGARTDNSDLTETGEAGSPLFYDANRVFVIFSAAWIFKTSAQAASFSDRLTAAMSHCGAAQLKSEVGATKSARLLSYGPLPIRGTHRWWNYRIVLELHAQGQTFKSFVDLGLGQVGRATGWLILHGAYRPIAPSVEAELVHVVQVRMGKSPH
jgi:hypothetical protein